MAKKIISGILGIIFIILVICAIVVGTYTLSSPKTDVGSDSRLLITGAWTDDVNDKMLEFYEDGTFKYSWIVKDETIADGYFKIDEKGHKIKLFILPGHSNEDFKENLKLYFFAEITYKDLLDPTKDDENSKELPSCTFFIKKPDNSSGEMLTCVMPEKTLDLYSKGKHFEAKHK
ncbi:MAG: hypothetical protein IJ746_01600 [Ruminococcus sp.]|nr:hypothetical protein [Ruminococcus sp.]